MKSSEQRHYTEEEILMFVLDEPGPYSAQLKCHLAECSECRGLQGELAGVYAAIQKWHAPEPPDDAWRAAERRVLTAFREQARARHSGSFLDRLLGISEAAWNYALENPLPTLGYVTAAIAFASERTITIFRLDRVLPETARVLEILKQMFQG